MTQPHNLAWMSTSTTGTGTITLGSAVAPWLTFAQAGVQDGETVSYTIYDPPNSECGRGVYTASGTTLTRGPLASTNSNAAINLSGNAQVYISTIAEDTGLPCWHVEDLVADNDASFPAVAMRLNASFVILYNPTTGSSKRIAPAEMTQNLICAVNAQGAGFRDQASAYAASDDVWFYWIWGASNGLNTINSKSSPTTGPTLPSGYTHYCPAFLIKVWVEAASVTIFPYNALSGQTKLKVRDRAVYYSIPVLLEPFGGISVYPAGDFDLTQWIPAAAKESIILLNPELHGGGSVQVIGGCVASTNGENIANMSLYPINGYWDHQDVLIQYPLTNRLLNMMFLVSTGTPDQSILDIFVNGYTF